MLLQSDSSYGRNVNPLGESLGQAANVFGGFNIKLHAFNSFQKVVGCRQRCNDQVTFKVALEFTTSAEKQKTQKHMDSYMFDLSRYDYRSVSLGSINHFVNVILTR